MYWTGEGAKTMPDSYVVDLQLDSLAEKACLFIFEIEDVRF